MERSEERHRGLLGREGRRRRCERRAPRTWQKPASCLVAVQRGGVPRGGPGLVTSFHRPHTCSLRRFELSRSEARAAKAHVQMRARQEASRGTPWDSSPHTAGGRPETVGERVGEAGFGGWLPGSAATRDDAPGRGVFGAGGARGRQAGGGEVSLPVGLRLGGRLRKPASEGSCGEVGAWRSVSVFGYPRRPGPLDRPRRPEPRPRGQEQATSISVVSAACVALRYIVTENTFL